MFDKLIDLIVDFLYLFCFWFVVDTYENAIVLQFGKHRRTIKKAGIYLKCPFGIDVVMSDNVVLKTMDLGTQSLMTKDDYKIVLSSFITYRIDDIKTFLLSVESAEDVLMSASYGVIAANIQDLEFENFEMSDFVESVSDFIKTKLAEYGVTMLSLDFQNMTETKTLRILADDIHLIMPEEE